MANTVYKSYYQDLIYGNADHFAGDVRVMLVSDAYSPNDTSHQTLADIISAEVHGTGYTTLGKQLTGRTATWDTVNNPHRLIYTANNAIWPTSTITARGAIVYRYSGINSTSPLWAYFDFGSNQSSSASDFIVSWDSVLGILVLEQIA